MKDSLAQAIYESVNKADEQREFNAWHASSIAECPRSHYFKRLGIERLSTAGAGKQLRWKAGHLMEEVLRPHLKSIYPDLKSNVRLESKELHLTGEYDNYSEKEAAIIEVKSVHDFAFQYKKKDDLRFHVKGEEPYVNHELQNHSYAILLGENNKPVLYIIYVYITLDGRIATYKTELNPEHIREVTNRLSILNEAWEKQEPPECLCTEEHYLWKPVTQYCDYKGKTECCSLELLGQ